MCVALSSTACAQEMIRYDAPCTRDVRPLRQSIVIIDENLIVDGDNSRWIRPALEFSDALGGVQRGTMLPGEPLTIYVAKQSGADLAAVFVGCSPNISDAERHKRESDSSKIGVFFGGSVAAQLEKIRTDFEKAMTTSFGIAVRGHKQSAKSASASIFRSVASAPRLLDLSKGIPRIFILSSFEGSASASETPRLARERGFEAGAQAGIDLQRAEIYVSNAGETVSPRARAFTEAFLLRSRGHVAGWRAEGVPQLLNAPVSLSVFAGTVKWSDIQAPIQIRIAADPQGNLVNSWVEITAGRSLASPITGKIICQSDQNCEATGDGRNMGQSWNPDPGEKPAFDPSFAWTGLRYFSLRRTGNKGVARIWDPQAQVRDGEKLLDEFRFEVQTTEQIQF
jgi:hypothetical protein